MIQDYLIYNKEKISLESLTQNKYLKINKKMHMKISGGHPQYLNDEFLRQKKGFILSNVHKHENDPLCFWDQFFILSHQGFYLSSNPQGELFFEDVSQEDLHTQQNFMKFWLWTIFDQNDENNTNPITVFNEVFFKSAFETFMSAKQNHIKTSQQYKNKENVFWISKFGVLPCDKMMYQRFNQSKIHLNKDFSLDLLFNNSYLQISQIPQQSIQKKFESIKQAENFIIEEIIYSLNGNEGQFLIRQKSIENNQQNFIFQHEDQFELGFVQLTKRILTLADLWDQIDSFISINNGNCFSLIRQQFIFAIRKFMNEYLQFLITLQQEFQQGDLDLQKIWFYIQKPLKTFERISLAIQQSQNSVQLLNYLYKHFTQSIDEEAYHLYQFLIQQTMQPYYHILFYWIWFGILEDWYQDFFIQENTNLNHQQFNQSNQNYWENKFILISNKVPIFLKQWEKQIFLIGKYINVLQHFYQGNQIKIDQLKPEIFEFSIHNEMLKVQIESLYQQSNQKIMEVVLKREKFAKKLLQVSQFYLQFKGDLMVNFIDSNKSFLQRNTEFIDINAIRTAFEQSLRNSFSNFYLQEKEIQIYLSKFQLSDLLDNFFANKNQQFFISDRCQDVHLIKDKKLYEQFNIDLNIEWPLNLVLTGDILFQYKIIWRLIFQLRNSERNLIECRENFNQFKTLKENKIIENYQAFIHKCLFFQKTLFNFFYFGILVPEYLQFENLLNSDIKEFDKIIDYQKEFLQHIFDKSLLSNSRIRSIIFKLQNFFSFFNDHVRQFITKYILPYKDFVQQDLHVSSNKITFYQLNQKREQEKYDFNKQLNLMHQQSDIGGLLIKYNENLNKQFSNLSQLVQKEQEDRDQDLSILIEGLEECYKQPLEMLNI